jgi:superfamily I DNA and RNA helicase
MFYAEGEYFLLCPSLQRVVPVLAGHHRSHFEGSLDQVRRMVRQSSVSDFLFIDEALDFPSGFLDRCPGIWVLKLVEINAICS